MGLALTCLSIKCMYVERRGAGPRIKDDTFTEEPSTKKSDDEVAVSGGGVSEEVAQCSLAVGGTTGTA